MSKAGAGSGQILANQTQIAKLIGVTTRTLSRWERAGKLTGNRPNNGVKLYPVEDAMRLAKR